MLKNTPERFGLVSISVHWLSAVVIFGLFGVGYWMVDLSYYSDWYRTAPHYHQSVGLLLLLLSLFRILWKFISPNPKLIANSETERMAAHAGHYVLYLLLLVILFSGYLISTADGRGIDVFNWFTLPSLGELFSNQEDLAGDIHKYVAYALMGFVALHILAALKHHFINKDNTLRRMLNHK